MEQSSRFELWFIDGHLGAASKMRESLTPAFRGSTGSPQSTNCVPWMMGTRPRGRRPRHEVLPPRGLAPVPGATRRIRTSALGTWQLLECPIRAAAASLKPQLTASVAASWELLQRHVARAGQKCVSALRSPVFAPQCHGQAVQALSKSVGNGGLHPEAEALEKPGAVLAGVELDLLQVRLPQKQAVQAVG
jgi:hypothetical protein